MSKIMPVDLIEHALKLERHIESAMIHFASRLHKPIAEAYHACEVAGHIESYTVHHPKISVSALSQLYKDRAVLHVKRLQEDIIYMEIQLSEIKRKSDALLQGLTAESHEKE